VVSRGICVLNRTVGLVTSRFPGPEPEGDSFSSISGGRLSFSSAGFICTQEKNGSILVNCTIRKWPGIHQQEPHTTMAVVHKITALNWLSVHQALYFLLVPCLVPQDFLVPNRRVPSFRRAVADYFAGSSANRRETVSFNTCRPRCFVPIFCPTITESQQNHIYANTHGM
jgi:hypothetical protein